MDINLIKKLVKLVDESGVTDLEIEQEGIRIKIAKKIRTVQGFDAAQLMPSSIPVSYKDSVSQSAGEENLSVKVEKETDVHEIRSPIVGTFYRAPAPDADSYVQVGDSISVGSVLCIVEAMKLMNEIESDVSGKIIKILVDNGKPVEYNQPLFLIKLS
ncbi:MAG: acetyl-CoA carboxylase, biotin carboxyl carrier protein [Ignavibacteria bacterium CG_4_9_14_3_um_filter_36_18]|nr:acetyl-CoA carboxylase biotin carboxyl carrier protein [Ignavibacteria bacterium]PJB01611.1 MAG: acetyl-CoA carboxylase, biotin carboxyl carrier protein [Ignavibacteria bacterium CG_4_9_14_3_um_filter_36_18]